VQKDPEHVQRRRGRRDRLHQERAKQEDHGNIVHHFFASTGLLWKTCGWIVEALWTRDRSQQK
jgi:hypothetical protein